MSMLAVLSAVVAYAAEGQLTKSHVTTNYSACTGEGAGMCSITKTTSYTCTGGMQFSCTPSTVVVHTSGYCAPSANGGLTCN